MVSTQNTRTSGLRSSVAIKGPVKACSTTNVTTLSGEQTINAIACVADDRVLLTAQTDASDNGVWVVSTGAWERAADYSNNNDVVEGTAVRVTRGTNAGTWILTTTGDITIDTTDLTFSQDVSLVGGALLASNNLSDVSSKAIGLLNLLGTAVTIASGATVDLSDQAVNTGIFTTISGSTTISAITMDAEQWALLRFSGAPQITVGASLVGNNEGDNLQVEAGDHALVHKVGSVIYFIHMPVRARAPLVAKGSAVASAATITIPKCAYVHVTGTTTISDVDFDDATNGTVVDVEFDSALTLTHSANLECPGAVDLTVSAGDVVRFIQDVSDAVKVIPLICNATAAEIWAGAKNKPITPAGMAAALAEVTLTDGATVTVDFTAGIHFNLDTIGGNRTFAATVTAAVVGRSGRIRVKQDGTGSRTGDFSGAPWKNVNSQNIVLSTPAASVDYIYYDIRSTTEVELSMGRAIG